MSAAHVYENESVQMAEQPAGVGAPDIGAPRSAVPALSPLCPRSVPAAADGPSYLTTARVRLTPRRQRWSPLT